MVATTYWVCNLYIAHEQPLRPVATNGGPLNFIWHFLHFQIQFNFEYCITHLNKLIVEFGRRLEKAKLI